MTKALAPLASLRLTVFLFVLALILIFAGTLAQREMGNWEVVYDYFRSFFVNIPLRHLVFYDLPGSLPFPGGFVIGGLMLVNLIAAHATRFHFTWKRAGILLTHFGLILLIAGEFVTAIGAEEGMMTLHEGGHANYAEDLREAELAIVQTRDDGQEDVVAVPQSFLVRGEGRDAIDLSPHGLPLAVRVIDWQANSGIAGPQMLAQSGNAFRNPATAGQGVRVVAVEQPTVSGVDVNNNVNQPSAYLEILHEGKPIGTYLVSVHFGGLAMLQPRETVRVGDAQYQLELRFKRLYKPYTLHLIELKHDVYVGTTTPRNFSSRVRLVDAESNEDREVLIWMNHPLRYRGDAIFQNQMDAAGAVGGVPTSGLQVVTNPGWLLPYISCILVSIGLTWHFGAMLGKFVNRVARAPDKARGPGEVATPREPAASRRIPGLYAWGVPALVAVVLAAIVVGGQLRPEGAKSPYDLAAFARLPVTAEGRVKPFDTVARNALFAISGRQSVRVPGEIQHKDGSTESGLVTLSASQWLLEAIGRPHEADGYEVFRVDHPDVKALIVEGGKEDDRKRFSWNEIAKNGPEIERQATLAAGVAENRRNAYQVHLLELWNHLVLYRDLQASHRPLTVPPLAEGQEWQTLSQALVSGHTGQQMHPAAAALGGIFTAYRQDDPAGFNARIADYAATLEGAMPDEISRASFETLFNRLAPFYQGTVLYVLAMLGAFTAVLFAGRDDPRWFHRLRVAAVTLLVLAFVVHTFGIAGRMHIQGRPPVTNLYSSAVFIGWVVTLVGLFIEWAFRNTLGTIVAAVIGTATLIVAHNLADGDTLQMMQAVLDSNFWLATHVIIITVGYGAMFLAGAFGIIYILTGVYTRALTPSLSKVLTKVLYGTIAFALLFSFVGTVLGGIWADQSWGRFWGWDPKENGAILIVLWAALILHARWGGMIQHRGVAVLAIGGNIVTCWSWFGTNMLDVGLHAYGGTDTGKAWLIGFAISQLALMSLVLIPQRRWASFEPAAIAARPSADTLRVSGSSAGHA